MSNIIQNDFEDTAMLTVSIKNRQPVDLIDYAQSMISLGAEYSSFIAASDNHLDSDEIKLYIKEVKSGSIITTLSALAPALMPFAEHSNTVIDFAKHLREMVDYLLGKNSAEKPEELNKQSLTRIDKLIEPVAKDLGSSISIDATNNHGTINITFDSVQANAMQNRIAKELDALKEPVTGLHTQVVLYWAQARNSSDGKSGDKARIESVLKGDVRVAFADDTLKHKMLHEQPHPFDSAYVVDVYVETVQEKPILYRVVTLHEVLPIN